MENAEKESGNFYICHPEVNIMAAKKILYVVSKNSDVPYSEKLLSLLDIHSSFRIVPLTFEQWQFQRTSFADSDKVLFIGHRLALLDLSRKIQIKYREFGISYGWFGNKAILQCDRSTIRKRGEYDKFLAKIREETDLSDKDLQAKEKDLTEILSLTAFAIIAPFGILIVGTKLLKDYFQNENQLEKQQYIYGIIHLYKYHLAEFMNS